MMKKMKVFYDSLTLPEKIQLREWVNRDDFLDHPDQYLIPTWLKANEDNLPNKIKKVLIFLYEEKGIRYINDIKRDDFSDVKNTGKKSWSTFELIKWAYELIKSRERGRSNPN